MNKRFQVSANTTEMENVKVREGDGCNDRRMYELLFYFAVGNREFEANSEHLQVRHERNPLEQGIWTEVRGWVDHDKMECDEAHSSRE